MKSNLKYIFFFLYFIIIGCNQRSIEPDNSGNGHKRIVSTYGSDATFDIATWNIENFPIEHNKTISHVKNIILDTDIDLFGLQEIDNANDFQKLMDSLPDYSGYVSDFPDDFLKLAIIYKTELISVSNIRQIFTDDNYAFPRPPLVAFVEVKKESDIVFDFILIVNHLKAFPDIPSRQRREDACNKLKDYIDTQILPTSEKDVIVLGDLNDALDDAPSENVFTVFLQDTSNYYFLTYDIRSSVSYPGFNSMIDHILITGDTKQEYADGITEVLKLDLEFSKYSTEVSDHRPVMAQFPVFSK